jgi:alpha-tubulin suppressor-like RCC1 family protein
LLATGALLLLCACGDDASAPADSGSGDGAAPAPRDGGPTGPRTDGDVPGDRDSSAPRGDAGDPGDAGDAGRPPADCSELDCGEGGYCEFAEGRPRCICRQGFDGPQCERNVCEPLLGDDPPCGDNTTCAVDDAQPVCSCAAGFAHCGEGAIQACTTNLGDDAEHCGACELACAGELGCADGSCAQAAIDIAAGYAMSCAVAPPASGTIDGALWCWGGVSVLGLPAATAEPAAMTHVPNVRDISLANNHGCGLTDSDSFVCWGNNDDFQLGDDLGGVVTLSRTWADLSAVAVGGYHSCARNAAGAVRCWGANQARELGNGSVAQRVDWDATVEVQYPPGVGLRGVTDLALGSGYTCALLATSEVLCWGSLELIGNQSPPELILYENGNPLSDVLEIDGGEYHVCALLRGGEVACFGWWDQGALGVPPSASLLYAVKVPGLANVRAVEAAGSFYDPFSCALRDDYTVVCWGSHPASTVSGPRSELQEVIAGPDDQPVRHIVEISGGDVHLCARQRTGQVSCWGANTAGQIGDGMMGGPASWPRLVVGFP